MMQTIKDLRAALRRAKAALKRARRVDLPEHDFIDAEVASIDQAIKDSGGKP